MNCLAMNGRRFVVVLTPTYVDVSCKWFVNLTKSSTLRQVTAPHMQTPSIANTLKILVFRFSTLGSFNRAFLRPWARIRVVLSMSLSWLMMPEPRRRLIRLAMSPLSHRKPWMEIPCWRTSTRSFPKLRLNSTPWSEWPCSWTNLPNSNSRSSKVSTRMVLLHFRNYHSRGYKNLVRTRWPSYSGWICVTRAGRQNWFHCIEHLSVKLEIWSARNEIVDWFTQIIVKAVFHEKLWNRCNQRVVRLGSFNECGNMTVCQRGCEVCNDNPFVAVGEDNRHEKENHQKDVEILQCL